MTNNQPISDAELELRIAKLVALAKYNPDKYTDKEVVRRLLNAVKARDAAKEREMLYDLDEIENKPWRVFRQLANLMPEYADTYTDYEAFYSYGGGNEVQKLIDKFKQTDDYKQSGFAERRESEQAKEKRNG